MNDARPRLIAHIENATLAFGERVILKNCTHDLVEGAITCINGHSRAGKSTSQRQLDGLLLPSEGHVYVPESGYLPHERRAAQSRAAQDQSVFPVSALLDSLTVGENVALPLREHTRLSEAEIRRTVMDSLESVGLAHAYDNLPGELSGGMLKRAGFARAIVTRPELVLYDEPTTGLDPIVTNLITDTILRLREKLKGTAVVISHDLQSIFGMADYVAMLFEGAIIACDSAERIRNSTNPIVQQFLQGSEIGPIPI